MNDYWYPRIASTEDVICERINSVCLWANATCTKTLESKSFRKSAKTVQNLVIWPSMSVMGLMMALSGWLSIMLPLCADEPTTYLRNYVVYILEWNSRILLFASILVRIYLGERKSSSIRPPTLRTSKFSPSLWRVLESSSLEYVGPAPSNQMDDVKQRINEY